MSAGYPARVSVGHSECGTVLGVGCSLCCVVCGLIALAGSSPWITESWVCRCRCRWVLWLGSCITLFDDVTYSLYTCVVLLFHPIIVLLQILN